MNFILIKETRINPNNIVYYEPVDQRRGSADIDNEYIDYGITFRTTDSGFNIWFGQDVAKRDISLLYLDKYVNISSANPTKLPPHPNEQ